MFSLVVPAFNEGEHIYDNLKVMSDTLSGFAGDFEILAVNDGSRDNTASEISRASKEIKGVRACGYEINRGKGGAIVEGVCQSLGDTVGFLDADLDLMPDMFESYLKEMKSTGCEVVIGSKMHKDSHIDYPPARKLFSFCYYIMLKVLFGLKCHDTQTGIKLFKGDLIRKVAGLQRIKGYAFDIEILALCARTGASIREMPVTLHYTREASFSRIRFKDVWKMFTDTWKVWWNLRVLKNYDGLN